MKVLAITTDGKLTYCCADPDKRGVGRCNHVFHKNDNESNDDFCKRMLNFSFVRFEESQKTNSEETTLLAGVQEKYWDENGEYLYKIDVNNEEDGMIQYNGLAEDCASKVLSQINGIECAEYSACFINGTNGVRTKNFLKEGEDLVSFDSLIDDDKIMERLTDIDDDDFEGKFNLLVDTLKEKTGKDFSNDIIKLIKVDLILMSADRHYGNISLIRGENEDYRFAPIYDNGSCLLAEDSYSDTDGYWDKKLNLPFGPQLFGFFPVKHYIKLCKKRNNENNRISVNPENIESFIEKYNCEYYSEEKVEKIKWLLWDNIEFYNELEIIDYED